MPRKARATPFALERTLLVHFYVFLRLTAEAKLIESLPYGFSDQPIQARDEFSPNHLSKVAGTVIIPAEDERIPA